MAKLLTGTRIYGTGTVDTQLFVSGTNSATSTTTGALQVVGGVGIGGNLHVSGIIYGAILGTATTATNADNIKTVLQTSSSSHYLTFVDANNSTATYEALYTTSSFVINPATGSITASGSVTASATGASGGLRLHTNSGITASNNYMNFFTGQTSGWSFNANGTGADTNQVAYITASGGAYFTGTVGIGFTSPNGKLDVAGDLHVGATQNTARFKSDNTNTFVDAIPALGAVVIRAGGSVEKLRVTANGGISFGASGTAYGTSGQILQSNGNAAPTWISTGSLAAANATTATHLSGGVAGQIPYQTAPGVTAFLSTGTAGNVLVSNGSSAPTYNNTLTLTGTTAATSTTTGALQVVGGVGVGGDLFIRGDILTNDTTFNLINANATTVNFAGAATTLAMGASGSGTTNVRNNLTVSGNLTVQGTTTIVDSTVTNIADPIITLGGGTGNTAPTADDNKDRGVAFKWVNNAGTTSTGFFGYDDSTGYLTYVQTATITNEVVSGTKGAMDVNLAGGTAMSVVYQSSPNNTAFLAATTSGYLLQTNGTGSAPSWVNASGVSAGSATYADHIRTLAQTASAVYFPTFVDSNNASNAYELVYTTGTFVINPATGYIGMGTASPQRPLHVVTLGSTVQGIAAFEANASGLVIQDNGSQNGNVEIVGYKQSSSTYHNILIRGSGDGLLVQNGTGNVGIGATSPAQKLDVRGYIVSDVNSNAVEGGFYLGNSGHGIRRQVATNDVYVYTAGGTLYLTANGSTSTQVAIVNSGNVGIGTTTPLSILDVAGSGTGVSQRIRTLATGSTNIALRIQDGTTGSTDGDGIYLGRTGADATNYLWTYENEPWVFATNNTERLRITAAGGIAFGGAANYGTSGFVLKSNGNAAPTWVDPSTLASASATNADNIRTVAQTAAASYYPTFVDSNNASNAYELVYTTSSFSINPSNGNIQIGMTGQDYQPSSGGSHTIRLNAANTSSIGFHDSGSTIGNLKFSGNFGFEIGAYDGLYGPHNTILHGSVGIGTQSPAAKLDIKLAADGDFLVGRHSASTAKLVYAYQSGSDGYLELRTGTDAIVTKLSGYTGTPSYFLSNVGVNTTAPRGKFESVTGANGVNTNADVPGTAGAFVGPTGAGQGSQLSIESNDAIAADTGGVLAFGGRYSGTALATWAAIKGLKEDATAGNYGGYLSFYTRTTGAGYPERMRITPAGGISFGASGTAYGSSGQVLKSNGNAAPTWIDQSSIAAGSAPLTSTYVGFGSGSNLLTGSSNLTWNGSRLHVAGPGNGTGGNITIGAQTNNTAKWSYIVSTHYAATAEPEGFSLIGGYTDATSNKVVIGGQIYESNPATEIQFWTHTATTHSTGGSQRMVIDTNGNVGIGTTAPNDRLHVQTSSATAYDATNDQGQYGSGAGITVTNLDETSQSFAQINLQVSGNSGRAVGRIVAIRTASATSDLAFVTENANTKAEKMRIFSNGNVSIGTTSTTNKFEVAGAAGQLFSVSDSFTGTIFSANDVSGIPSIEVLDTGLVKFAQYGGQVAINTGTVASSTASLSVYGIIQTMGTLGEIRASSEITAYFSSDRRLKENIKLIENPITIIDQIRGVTFDWTDEHMAHRGGEDGYFVRKHDIGVIAQEVQAVLPELVGTREDGYLAVKYEKMVPLLIEAIKAQQKTIDTLTSEIKEIKEFLSSLKNN